MDCLDSWRSDDGHDDEYVGISVNITVDLNVAKLVDGVFICNYAPGWLIQDVQMIMKEHS